MIQALGTFFWTQCILAIFGMAIAMLPSLRRTSISSRVALSWLAGATLVSILAPLLDLTGAWGERSIAIPLIAAAIAIPLRARRRAHAARLIPEPAPLRWSPATLTLLAASLALLAWSIASGRAVGPYAIDYEIAKAARWAEEGIDLSAFSVSDPAALPLASFTPMWTEMLERDAAPATAMWLQFLIVGTFIGIARTPLLRALEPAAAAVALSAITITLVSSIIAAQSAATSLGWLLVLAPLALLLSVSPGTPLMFLITVAGAVALSHRAGIALALALALFELARHRRRRALWVAGAAGVAILPWWALLAVRGLAPWSGTLRPHVSEWQTIDAGLIVVAIVSALLIASRWRRFRASVPALVLITIMIGVAVTHASTAASGTLLALRLSAPLLISAACLLTMRPLTPGEPGFLSTRSGKG